MSSVSIDQPSSGPGRHVEIAGGGAFPLCLEGLPYIGGGLVVALAVSFLVDPLAAIPFLAFAAFSAWFFRNPVRRTPADADAVISPADGVICAIGRVEENDFLKKPATKVSIFMSVLNVHVNRAPIAGAVAATKHIPGTFAIASADKASTHNERNAVLLEQPSGRKLLFYQVAGSIARRIICYAKPGDRLTAGQRFGLIRFGSRVDLYFTDDMTVDVKVGQKIVGGETILGRYK